MACHEGRAPASDVFLIERFDIMPRTPSREQPATPSGALPAHVPPNVRAALTEAQERLREAYGERLRRVVLYGSRARGDATEESDVDVLVVLSGPIENSYQEIKRANSFWGEFLTRYGLSFSVKPYTEEAYRDRRRPFIRNVRRDGIPL